MGIDDDTFPPEPHSREKLRSAIGSVACKWDSRHDITVFVVLGQVSFRHLVAGFDKGIDLGLAERMLWNVVGADLSRVSLGQLGDFVSHVFQGPWAPRQCAILAAAGPALAAASLIVLAAEEKGFGDRIEAFVHRDAALDWLGVRDRPTVPAPPDDDLLRQ